MGKQTCTVGLFFARHVAGPALAERSKCSAPRLLRSAAWRQILIGDARVAVGQADNAAADKSGLFDDLLHRTVVCMRVDAQGRCLCFAKICD